MNVRRRPMDCDAHKKIQTKVQILAKCAGECTSDEGDGNTSREANGVLDVQIPLHPSSSVEYMK